MRPETVQIVACVAGVTLVLYACAEFGRIADGLAGALNAIGDVKQTVEDDARFCRDRCDAAEAEIARLKAWTYYDPREARILGLEGGDGHE